MKKRVVSVLVVCCLFLFVGVGALAANEVDTDQEMSDDLYSFQLKIDGDLYQFPMPFEDLLALGWRCMEDSFDMEENSVASIEFKKGYLGLDFELINQGEETISSEESLVGGVGIYSYDLEDMPETSVELPGGIVYGVSGTEDIIAAYGMPENCNDYIIDENTSSLRYQYWTYRFVSLQVYDGVLSAIELWNFVDTANAKAALSDGSDVTPCELVENYVAPEELGEEPLSYIMEFEGDLYQIPAPLYAFLENGWKIQTEYSDSMVDSYEYGSVSIMRDNQTIRVAVVNYDTVAREVENCFVPLIKVDNYSDVFSMTIPSGITTGMSDEDVRSTLDSIPKEYLPKYWVNSPSEDTTEYELRDFDYDNQGIKILVNKTTNILTKIEIYHLPERLS